MGVGHGVWEVQCKANGGVPGPLLCNLETPLISSKLVPQQAEASTVSQVCHPLHCHPHHTPLSLQCQGPKRMAWGGCFFKKNEEEKKEKVRK